MSYQEDEAQTRIRQQDQTIECVWCGDQFVPEGPYDTDFCSGKCSTSHRESSQENE